MRKYKQTESADVYGSMCEAHLASPAELSAYIDKELPTWKRHLIRRHLKKCATCAKHVQQLQQTNDFLHRGGEIEVSDDFFTQCNGVRLGSNEIPETIQLTMDACYTVHWIVASVDATQFNIG